MFSETAIKAKDKHSFYAQLEQQLDHLLEGEPNFIANLSNMSSLLALHLQEINWAGFYLYSESDGQLILGPFQGKPACIRIPMGRGVCGTAAEQCTPIVVDDVFAFPGHIACDPASRSEIVIPIVHEDRLIGVLDIDSPKLARFDDEDRVGMEKLVTLLTHHSNLP